MPYTLAAPNQGMVAPREARHEGSGGKRRTRVGVTRWVSALGRKSPRTHAWPAGPERTRVHARTGGAEPGVARRQAACERPDMGSVVGSWRALPAMVRGKADGGQAPDGRRPGRVTGAC
jgi:hypothetical protein